MYVKGKKNCALPETCSLTFHFTFEETESKEDKLFPKVMTDWPRLEPRSPGHICFPLSFLHYLHIYRYSRLWNSGWWEMGNVTFFSVLSLHSAGWWKFNFSQFRITVLHFWGLCISMGPPVVQNHEKNALLSILHLQWFLPSFPPDLLPLVQAVACAPHLVLSSQQFSCLPAPCAMSLQLSDPEGACSVPRPVSPHVIPWSCHRLFCQAHQADYLPLPSCWWWRTCLSNEVGHRTGPLSGLNLL